MCGAQRWIRWVLLASLASAAASTAAGPVPPDSDDHYRLLPLAEPATPQALRRCLGPDVEPAALQRFLEQALVAIDPSGAAQLSSRNAPGVALAAAGAWTCVPLSAQGFPRWPTEALHGLIVPVGVPLEQTRRWRRAMLDQVALDGVARGLIVYPSGDAEQFIVIAEQGAAQHVKFTRRMLRAGEYRDEAYTAVLRHPAIRRVVTRSTGPGAGTPQRLAIPLRRLAQPVHNGFVQIAPSTATRTFAFAGTRWSAPGADVQLELNANGRATRTSAGAPEAGSWSIVDGVLRVALAGGTRYALALESDRVSLGGMARRDELNSVDDEGDEGDEWQWQIQLRRESAPEAASSQSA